MARLSIDESALRSTVMPRLEAFLRGFVQSVESEAKAIAPVRTGNLRRLIRAQPVRRTGEWSLSSGVESMAPYSAPVHEGSRPHVIRPRTARALRFEVAGRVVFAARVNHPGTRAQPFLRDAVQTVIRANPYIE